MHGNMDMRIRSARSSRSSAAWPADVRAYIVLVEGAAVLVPLGRLMSPGSAFPPSSGLTHGECLDAGGFANVLAELRGLAK